ncbi:hypothetical protein [Parasediminibacterium sp. JCM 36343]|uniref:hypothetical protein n=1 Tax=Parasediminibacterium sp. JCM 36343 TaxID=3374279 RepID=UPI003979D900
MEELLIEKTAAISSPSLLRQIVDEVDMMDAIQQHQLLLSLRKDKILASVKALDKKLEALNISLTENEITDMISQDRRGFYANKTRD